MDPLDTSWCPVCDRQIIPKRFLVPLSPPPQPAPAPPPSTPQLSPQKSDTTTRRTKGGTIRARGGLVHGTGRVKPNGALKRADSNSSTKSQSATAPLPVNPAPVKRRVVIDQGPVPLYCSDECQLADLENMRSGLSINYIPDRASPPLPPVPHNSFTEYARSESESDTSSSSSVESQSWLSEPSPSSTTSSDYSHQYASPSMATIASMYNFPPLPPPPPILSTVDSTSSSSDSDHSNDFQSGIMMAGRRMNAIFRPEPAKRSPYGYNNNLLKEPRKPIPGWTDGSSAWRAEVYSFSAPMDQATAADPIKREDTKKAYGSCIASPHRSRGVHSTLGESTPTSRSVSLSSSPPRQPVDASVDELSLKFSASFSRRCESRVSLYPSSPSSVPSTTTAPRRERSLLKPGAEGKLLVPDVKMKVHGGSSASLSSTPDVSGDNVSSYPLSSRRSVRSPLGRHGSTVAMENETSSLPVPRRPVPETRSWSYDNLKTYPLMQLPPKKEKRVVTRVIDGVKKLVEVEVEVGPSLQRLFLFPGKEVSQTSQ